MAKYNWEGVGSVDGVYKNSFFIVCPAIEAKTLYFATLSTEKYKRLKLTDNRVLTGQDLIGQRRSYSAVNEAVVQYGG